MRLPFTQEQFFGVFESYNTAVFPMQILLALIGCAMIICVLMYRSRITGFLLGCVWIWTGFAYHIMFFTRINKAAFIFGAAFIAQGVLFIILAYRNQFLFVYRKDTVKRISSFFILFGLVLCNYSVAPFSRSALPSKRFFTARTTLCPCLTTVPMTDAVSA